MDDCEKAELVALQKHLFEVLDAFFQRATGDLSKEVFATAAGRERLAALVEEIAGIEAKAVDELENAVTAMR